MTRVRAKVSPGSSEASLGELSDFSLVNGGLLNQLWRRTRLSGDALQLVHRRALVAAMLGDSIHILMG